MQLAASVCTRVCLCAWETIKKWIMESAGSGETKRGVSVNSEAWRDGSCKLAGEWLVGRALQPKQTTEASKQTCERAHTKRRVSMSGIWEHNVYHSPKTHQVLISFLLWVCLCVCVWESSWLRAPAGPWNSDFRSISRSAPRHSLSVATPFLQSVTSFSLVQQRSATHFSPAFSVIPLWRLFHKLESDFSWQLI